MKWIVPAALVIVALIHLLPLAGVAGPERLATLYGVSIEDPNLQLLMRHRAVLFGLLGAFLLVAAFRPQWHAAALVAAAVSVISFLWLAAGSRPYNAQIARVVAADVVALLTLVIGAVAHVWLRLKSS
jgi:hypothetical protein